MEGSCLYHYCSTEKFLSIIKNETIRLSEITKSNDRGEILFLLEEYISYLKSECKNEWAPDSAKYLLKEQLSKTYFLAACFSEKYDSLHMWTCYGDKGICIGFNKDKLSAWSKHIDILNNKIIYYDNENDKECAVFKKVSYCEEQDIKEKIRELCNEDVYVTDSFPRIFNKTAFIKSRFWEEEAEWRIVLPLILSEKKDLNIQNGREVELHVDSKLKNSCDIPFDLNMIENITLAPNFEADVSELRKCLHFYNLDFLADSVRLSKGSIR